MGNRARVARHAALALLGLVAAYGVLGAFVAPPLARKAIVARLQDALGRPVQLDAVHANPYTLQVRATGLRILEPDGKAAFASFDTLDVDGSASSFLHLAPVIDAARLAGLHVHVVRRDDGRYSFDDIVARLAAASKRKAASGREEPARFSVGNVQLDGGSIDFDDLPAHATHRVSDLRLAIPLVSNLPTHRKDRVRPSFSASVNGSPLRLVGDALPFEDTIRTHFTLDLQGVRLERYLAYLPPDLPVKLDRGTLDAKVALRFSQAPGRDPAIDLAGTAALTDVAASTAEGALAQARRIEAQVASADPLHGSVKLDALRVEGVAAMAGQWTVAKAAARDIDADLRTRAIRIGSFESEGGKLALEREPGGAIAMPRVPASGPSAPWKVALAKATVTGYDVALRDRTLKGAPTQRVSIARLEANDVTTDHGGTGQALVQASLDRGGRLEGKATFALEPLEVKATVDARGIDLVPARAYMAHFPSVELKSALASAKGTVVLQDRGGKLRVAYDGDAQVERFATFDTLNREDLLNWRRVKTSGIKLDLVPGAPLKLAIADVDVDGAYSRIFVNPEGKLNVQQLMDATEDEPDPPARTGPPPPRDIRIDRIRFAGSRLNFTDHYIRPNYTADVGDVKGAVTKLSSDPASRATVMLAGTWDGSSPVVIAGTVNPLAGNLFLDIGAQAKEIDLTKLTAYSQRYAGYGIKQGRLTLDVKYHVDGGKMEGRNRILVDQLAFGDKVESPDATSLPVLFVVNLLKDKDGRINLELPVSGSLDDPHFEIGAVIAQVFGSHLAKAATSPFSLIAGAQGDDLGFVEFTPGEATLAPAAQAKLDSLVKVLQDRPGLKLEIEPATPSPQDVEALAAAALQKRLAAAPKDLSKEAREKLAKQPAEVSDADRAALAAARIEKVKAYLAAESRLGADRVVIASAAPSPGANGGSAPGPARASRVDFALR